MLTMNSNPELAQAEHEIVKTCLKYEMFPYFISTNDYLAYEIQIASENNNLPRFKRGLIYSRNCKHIELNNFSNTLERNNLLFNWNICGKAVKNPYTCCNLILFNIIKNEIETFCIHSNYLEEEILSYDK